MSVVSQQAQVLPQVTAGQIIAKYQASAAVDVVAIARELGLSVWQMHLRPAEVSGKIFRDPLNGGPSGFSIVVNAGEPPERQRFTVAHEIAHFILHRAQLENGEVVDDTMYRSGLSGDEEKAANLLAAEILMPLPLIQKLVNEGTKEVDLLAAKLQVSPAAMKIRLGIQIA
jgi:IrrE N-terminal-like domain